MYNKNKLYKISDRWSNFDILENCFGVISWSKWFFEKNIFYVKAWPKVAFTSWDIGYIVIICFSINDVIGFLIKPFCYVTTKSGQKFKYLLNKKSFYGVTKSCRKLSQNWDWAFKFTVSPLKLISKSSFLLFRKFNFFCFVRTFVRNS